MVQTKIKNITKDNNSSVYHEIVLSPLQSKDKTQDFELSTTCLFQEVRIDTSEIATDLLTIPKNRQNNLEMMAMYAVDLIKEAPDKTEFNIYLEGFAPFIMVTVHPTKKRNKVSNLEIQLIARGIYNILRFVFKSKEAIGMLDKMWETVELNHKLTVTNTINEVISNPSDNQIVETKVYGYVDYFLLRSSVKKAYSVDVELDTSSSVRDCAIWVQEYVTSFASKCKDSFKQRMYFNLTQGYVLSLIVDLDSAYYLTSDYRAIIMGLVTKYYNLIGIDVPVPMPKPVAGSAVREAAVTKEN